MRNKHAVLFTIILIGYLNKASAQDNSQTLDPVTISSSLTEIKSSQSGRNIVIITGDKFNALPVHSIDELLRYIPGVEVQSRGPLGAQSDIVLRGGTFQQVLVIMDGVRLNDPNTGHFTSYIPVTPSEIERIEILKGASSAIYGSEAVGGVINIITKSFAANLPTHKYNVAAQAIAGQYDLYSINAGADYSGKSSIISGGIFSNNTTGQAQRGTNGFVHNTTGSLSYGHFFSHNWHLSLRSSYDTRNFSAQNFYTNFISDTANEKVKTFWNQLQLVHVGINHKITFDAGYKNLKDHYAFTSAFPANENTSNLVQGIISDEWKLKPSATLVSGVQFINKKINSNDRGNHRVDQSAAFIILNENITPDFLISPAARIEWNERSGWDFVPQINLSYHVDKFQLRGSAGKTIRDADFTERFNNYNKPIVTSGSIGNPDLQDEHSFSYEAGADYYTGNHFRISATFFQQYFTNLIDFVNTPYAEMPRKDNLVVTGSYALAKNIAKVNNTGVETDIQYSVLSDKIHQLWITAGFTWLQSNSDNGTPSFYVSSHARILTNFNFYYKYKMIGISFNGIYKQRTKQNAAPPIASVSSDYFIVNGKLEAFLLKNRVSLFVEADNIGDVSYTDLLGSKMPARWLMAGLKISLSK